MGEDFVQQEGQGQRCHIPQDGGLGGEGGRCWRCFPRQPAVFVSVFCPCLFPVTTALGMTVAWLSPLVPVQGCTITAWLETHTHANTTAPLQPVGGGPGVCRRLQPRAGGREQVGAMGRGLAGGCREGRTLPPPLRRQRVPGRGCLLLPGPNLGTSGVFVGCSLFLP